MSAAGHIALRGVAVHNLQHVDLDIPRERLVVFCGVSGSGKSSLALDTLYAEGQRRYIESFSAYTRQFLGQLDKPDAERIDGIPPAVAVQRGNTSRSSRSTVATMTEAADYLRLLYAKIGRVICDGCGRQVRRESPDQISRQLAELDDGTRLLVTYSADVESGVDAQDLAAALKEDGFVRVIAGDRLINITAEPLPEGDGRQPLFVVVDRLSAGAASQRRLRDSLEAAFEKGDAACQVWIEEASIDAADVAASVMLGGNSWRRIGYSARMRCEDCGREYPEPEPRLYSFNDPLGACPQCEGFGNIIDIDMELVVPDTAKSIRDGAIAPWNTAAYAHEREELLALADDYELPVDVPFSQLTADQLELIRAGVPDRDFGGLNGFFAWLARRKYKMHIRVFLSRWRSYLQCPACHGQRLRPEALATRVGGQNLAEVCAMKVRDALQFFKKLELTTWERTVGHSMLEQVRARLGFLEAVGLDYLTLDRRVRTLSGGEAQRVSLTSALGSSLVNMLYVLDEPSIGLHPHDTDRLIGVMKKLRDRGNSVVVVEHDEAVLRSADELIEIGPAAGQRGGKVVFQGTPAEIEACPTSSTGDYLAGRREIRVPTERRQPNHGWIRLAGARGNNLQDVTVEFPLGLLCVVTGVSGSGKSTLIQDTLYPALCRRLRKEAPKPFDCDDVYGDGQLADCVLVDQSPVGRSPRSNPVTYIKAFDEIRAVFADTVDARTRNYTASHFSFNVDGGRCNTCHGEGHIRIDMQFMADVYMKCAACRGQRFQRDILEVVYRGRNIADVLEMTVREAFIFFRGRPKVQARLKRLIDVGLDYIRLGQPANTLSGGEAQRLKLASYMNSSRRGRCLFLLDEPTTGLHFSDIVQLLDCFDALLDVGHSLIVVEHNLQLIKSADHIVDLGPGAADEGGQLVAEGTPESVARNARSVTGQFLAAALAAGARERSA